MTQKNIEFRYMIRGKHRAVPSIQDILLTQSTVKKGAKKHQALLMLHGFTSSPAVYRQMYPALAHYDAIFIPNLPGHSGDLEDFSRVSAQEWIEFTETTCKTLLSEYKYLDILGFSLGGLLSCHVSQKFPIRHQYLLAPSIDICTPWSISLKYAILFLRGLRYVGFNAIRSNSGNLRCDRLPELAYRRVSVNSIIQIMTLIETFEFLPPICPTDVFFGSYDEVIQSKIVANRFFGCKQVNIHWLENSAHMLPLDCDMESIIAYINANNEKYNQS